MNGFTVSCIVVATLFALTSFGDCHPTNSSKSTEDDALQCMCDCKKRSEDGEGRRKIMVPVSPRHSFYQSISWQKCIPAKNITLGEVIYCEGTNMKMMVDLNEERNGFVLSWASHEYNEDS